MIDIKTYPIDDQNLKNCLERIGDLINMDEPMLSLFKDKRNDNLYLFDWTDNNETHNRWLVYKIDVNVLSRFINKSISYKGIFDTVNDYYLTDIQSGQKPPFDIQKVEKLPTEYYPNTNLLFDESDTKNLDRINSVLLDLIKKGKQQKRSFDSSKNVIRDLKKYRAFEEQRFTRDIHVIPLKTGENDITKKNPYSNLFRQNDNELNRLLQKTRLDLLYR